MKAVSPIIAAALLALGASSVCAAGIAGTWLTEGGVSKIRLEPCGATLCGKLVWLAQPVDPKTGGPVTDRKNPDPSLRGRALVGVELITGIKPAEDAGEWTARAYNADDGKTYDVTLKLDDEGKLELEGCGLGGIICQGETWTRAGD